MKCYVVTGASRGLGLGIARAVIAQGDSLVALARSETPSLQALGETSPGYRFIATDLSDAAAVSHLAEELFGSLAATGWNGVYLVNNAGTVEPVSLAGSYDDAALARIVAINLTAPIQLGNAFLRHLQHHEGDRRILNISSGAARNPYPGWSAYCTTKAALEMYSRCAGLEQSELIDGVRIAAIAPGIVDTDMQAVIRSMSADDFPNVEQFRSYKTNGDLGEPDARGAAILRALHDDRVGFGDILNIRDFLC